MPLGYKRGLLYFFDEALKRYNAKQKRSDRKIDDYYEKIRRGKQEKLFHEVIFQIGNKDDMNVQSNEGQLTKDTLCEFMEQFKKRNPNLYVFSSHMHMDGQTPHLHIDFIPYATGSKRGLDTRVFLKQAFAAHGFKGGTRSDTKLSQRVAREKEQLAAVMRCHGIEWEQKEHMRNIYPSWILRRKNGQRKLQNWSRYAKRAKRSGRKRLNSPQQMSY